MKWVHNISIISIMTILCKLCIQRTNDKHHIIHKGSSNHSIQKTSSSAPHTITFSQNPINQWHFIKIANTNHTKKRISFTQITLIETQSIAIIDTQFSTKQTSKSTKIKIEKHWQYILETNISVLFIRSIPISK